MEITLQRALLVLFLVFVGLALVCASMSCPSLRAEPFYGERLEKQLEDQARAFLRAPKKFKIDRGDKEVHLSQIFKWFGADFKADYKPGSGFGDHDGAERASLNYVSKHIGPSDAEYLRSGDMTSNTSIMTGLSTSSKSERKGLWKPILLLTVVVGALVAAKVFNLGEQLSGLQEWSHGLGPWGVVVFIALYVAMTVAMLPDSVLTLAFGAMFGSLVGVIAVSIDSTLGVSLAFLNSRYFARDAVEGWFSGREKLQKLDQMTERQGAAIVAITRLVPRIDVVRGSWTGKEEIER